MGDGRDLCVGCYPTTNDYRTKTRPHRNKEKQLTENLRTTLGAKLMEHLEAAQAITDELGLDQTGYLVERALDDARAVHWPHLEPNIEAFRKPPRNR